MLFHEWLLFHKLVPDNLYTNLCNMSRESSTDYVSSGVIIHVTCQYEVFHSAAVEVCMDSTNSWQGAQFANQMCQSCDIREVTTDPERCPLLLRSYLQPLYIGTSACEGVADLADELTCYRCCLDSDMLYS